MQKITYTYHEPMFMTFDNEGPDLASDEILALIERTHPEAVDIEVVNIEEIN